MMTVSEFLGRCWYRTNLIIIKWQVFDTVKEVCNIEQIKEKAIYVGTPHELRSDIYKNVREMTVDSFGAMDDYIIIETHC